MSSDISLSPCLQAFFSEFLIKQKQVSAETVAAYRDAYSLLFRSLQDSKLFAPHNLSLDDLDAPTVLAFLDYLDGGAAWKDSRDWNERKDLKSSGGCAGVLS